MEKEWTAWTTEDNEIVGLKILFDNLRNSSNNGKLHFTTGIHCFVSVGCMIHVVVVVVVVC